MRGRSFSKPSEAIDLRARTGAAWALCLGTLVIAVGGCSDDKEGQSLTAGYAVWAASPQSYDEVIPIPNVPPPPPLAFSDQTLRQILRVSGGGDTLRVRFSNSFGSEPLTIDAAGVARSTGAANVDGASETELRFDGNPSVTIAAGAEVWSDYAELALAPESDIAVSIYLAGQTPVHTVHSLARQTAYLAPGNVVDAPALMDAQTLQSYYWLSGIEATSTASHRVLLTFGDSITDGFNSTADAAHRYPNYLSRALQGNPATSSYSVVNAGISGNRVLNDVIGPSGASRFDRDALGQAGVTDVIILLGINDIGFSSFVPTQAVSATDITGGLARFVASAKANQVSVYLATLLPFVGAGYYSDEGEAKRQAVNAWIRSNPDVNGVIDFDQLMADPTNPGTLLPAYDSSDHLHPNDQGYEAMADGIDPALFE
jgi:lysophospholipase L1-like esterase